VVVIAVCTMTSTLSLLMVRLMVPKVLWSWCVIMVLTVLTIVTVSTVGTVGKQLAAYVCVSMHSYAYVW